MTTETKKMEIIETTDGHSVSGSSGKTYTVAYCGSGDADPDYVALWECTCPAFKYRGGLCKHINAVIEKLDEDENEGTEL